MNKPELLMPAGNLEKLKIAVTNGADAVYFGAQKFNMRTGADNFSNQDIKEGITFCHFYNKKAYLTLNTSLKDSEIEDALEVAKFAFESGIDALIVQDIGLIKLLRELLPDLELHASTQMTCNNIQGAEFLANFGFKKIVLARELNLLEIKEISDFLHSKNVEVEVFTHGAECFSYSGQCLFSSFVFNKSGNRGRCMQPCRLVYSKVDSNDKARFLSMKDLCTFEIIQELIDAGIDSLKVEGRLKSNEYIQNVSRVYRKSIDNCFGSTEKPTLGELMEMKKAYLRKNGTLYLKDEEEKTTIDSVGSLGLETARIVAFRGQGVLVELLENLDKYDKLTRIMDSDYENLFIKKMTSFDKELKFARKGQKVFLEFNKKPYLQLGQILYNTTPKQYNPGKKLSYEYNMNIHEENEMLIANIDIPQLNNTKFKSSFKIKLDYVLQSSQTRPVDSDMLKDKLFKEYSFYIPKNFTAVISKEKFIPLSKLKEFKNQISNALEEVEEKFVNIKSFERKKNELLNCIHEKKDVENNIINNNIENKNLFIFVDDYRETVIDETKGLKANKIFYYNDENTKLIFPKNSIVKAQNIQSSSELSLFEKKAVENNWIIVCANIGSLQIALKNKLGFIIDREMNCYNSIAVNYYSDLGAQNIIPSIELSLDEIKKLTHREKIITLLFFYPLLMTSKAYDKKNIFEKNKFLLTDRKDFEYRARFENNLFKLYNPLPVDMLFEIETFSDFNNWGIDLKETTIDEAINVLKYYLGKINHEKPTKKSKFTRGHYFNPIE